MKLSDFLNDCENVRLGDLLGSAIDDYLFESDSELDEIEDEE